MIIYQEQLNKMNLDELSHEVLRLDGLERMRVKLIKEISVKVMHPYPAIVNWSSKKRGYSGWD